jgi:hypothetical protein
MSYRSRFISVVLSALVVLTSVYFTPLVSAPQEPPCRKTESSSIAPLPSLMPEQLVLKVRRVQPVERRKRRHILTPGS